MIGLDQGVDEFVVQLVCLHWAILLGRRGPEKSCCRKPTTRGNPDTKTGLANGIPSVNPVIRNHNSFPARRPAPTRSTNRRPGASQQAVQQLTSFSRDGRYAVAVGGSIFSASAFPYQFGDEWRNCNRPSLHTPKIRLRLSSCSWPQPNLHRGKNDSSNVLDHGVYERFADLTSPKILDLSVFSLSPPGRPPKIPLLRRGLNKLDWIGTGIQTAKKCG